MKSMKMASKLPKRRSEGTHGFALHHNPLKTATTPKEIDDWFDNYDGNFTGRIRVTDEELEWARAFAKNLRETTDKAIVLRLHLHRAGSCSGHRRLGHYLHAPHF